MHYSYLPYSIMANTSRMANTVLGKPADKRFLKWNRSSEPGYNNIWGLLSWPIFFPHYCSIPIKKSSNKWGFVMLRNSRPSNSKTLRLCQSDAFQPHSNLRGREQEAKSRPFVLRHNPCSFNNSRCKLYKLQVFGAYLYRVMEETAVAPYYSYKPCQLIRPRIKELLIEKVALPWAYKPSSLSSAEKCISAHGASVRNDKRFAWLAENSRAPIRAELPRGISLLPLIRALTVVAYVRYHRWHDNIVAHIQLHHLRLDASMRVKHAAATRARKRLEHKLKEGQGVLWQEQSSK